MGTFGDYYGSMEIPESKRPEFARQMTKLLNIGGMVDFEKVNIYGYELSLLMPIKITESGKIHFNYNYFEDNYWEDGGFNAERCRFFAGKISDAEFGDIVMAAYTLYELYDDNVGFARFNGDIINTVKYAGWINHILGTSFSLKKRFRVWENAEKMAMSRTGFEEFIPEELSLAAGGTEYADVMYILNGTESINPQNKEIKEGTYPYDVLKCKQALKTYMNEYSDEKLNKLYSLLTKDYHLREVEEDNDLKSIADLSLTMPARVFVYLTNENIEGHDFWKEWEKLKDSVYHDEKMKTYASDEIVKWREEYRNKPIAPVPTSEFLKQYKFHTFWDESDEVRKSYEEPYFISDDDRLYWWDCSEEVKISENMDKWLKSLAEQYKAILDDIGDTNESIEWLQYFIKLLSDINGYYKRIYAFREMFYEFIGNCGKKEYIAAVKLLQTLAESDEYKRNGKIIDNVRFSWDLSSKNITQNKARLGIKRYLSVLSNKKLRTIYFGF